MELKKFFNDVIRVLRRGRLRYAVAGGLIASVYRETERLTKDLDFLILATSHTQKKAEQIIAGFGLQPTVIRKADLEGGPMFAIKRKTSTPWMVCGRAKADPKRIGLDFILPEMPWFTGALERAEKNCIDFGIGLPVPALTVEDVILTKLFALKNKPQRFQDLDDLQSIFAANADLELAYLINAMKESDLRLPKELKSAAPKELVKLK